MMKYEYLTHNVPLQPGPAKNSDKDEWQSGYTTHILNELGKDGWELVAAFPWMIQQGSVLNVQKGPQQQASVILFLKRRLDEGKAA